MKASPTLSDKSAIGFEAKRLRLSFRLNQADLAAKAGVPETHVDLLEHNYPVPLDSRRRILRELWAIKTRK